VEVLSNPDTDVNPSFVTVSSLRGLYNTIAYRPAADDKNILVTGLSREDPGRSSKLHAASGDASYIAVVVGGGRYNSMNHVIQENRYAVAMSYPTPQIYFSVSGTGDPFVNWYSSSRRSRRRSIRSTVRKSRSS